MIIKSCGGVKELQLPEKAQDLFFKNFKFLLYFSGSCNSFMSQHLFIFLRITRIMNFHLLFKAKCKA